MRKAVREVFLGTRFLISLYFALISLTMNVSQQSILITTVALYFSIALLMYVRGNTPDLLNKALDLLFIPVMVLLSQNFWTLFALLPATVVHTTRSVQTGLLTAVAGVLVSLYVFSESPILLFSTLILFSSVFVSSLVPDILGQLNREREALKQLRVSYRKILQDFARWERERRELELLKFLTDSALNSQDVKEFLQSVRERLKIKKIRVIPKEVTDLSVMKDKDKGLLSVPVKLEEGGAVIIFEMESPFQLNDDVVVKALERAGRMVSLYIAGFENDSSVGKAINIS